MAKLAIISAATLFVALCSGAPSKNLGVKIPNACKYKPFCAIRPDGYDEIERKINKKLSRHLIANMVYRYGQPSTTQITEFNEDNCPSTKSSLSFYTIRTPGKTNVDIIVQTKLLQQTVEVVTCAYDKISDKPQNQQCFEELGLNHVNLRTSCQEKYATRSLLIYDPALGHLREKNYTIPVCCSCQIKHL